MKVIGIVNLKGGVGKTVTACNMAAILAEFHRRSVVLVDADAQANATQFFGCRNPEVTFGGILDGDCSKIVPGMRYAETTTIDNLLLVPADIGLLNYDIASVRSGGNGVTCLMEYLDNLRQNSETDYVVIDCPPAFSAASVAAIANSDAVIIPVKIDAFSMHGLDEIARQIYGLRVIRPEIRIAGVLVTMFHKADVQHQGLALLHSGSIPVFEHVIRRTDKVDESTFAGQPIYRWSRTSSAGIDYMDFVQEFVDMEGDGNGEE